MDSQKACVTLQLPLSFPKSTRKRSRKTQSTSEILEIVPTQEALEETNDDNATTSRLREFRANNFNEVTPEMRELFASTAKSVMETLVANLLFSWRNLDVATMVEFANGAFRTLDWVCADYSELYEAVRILLSRCAQLSSAKGELQDYENDEVNVISSLEDIAARSNEAAEAEARAADDYTKAEESLSLLRDRILNTQEALRRLREEAMQRSSEFIVLRKNLDCSRDNLAAIKNEEKELAERVEKRRKIVEKIRQNRNEIEGDIVVSSINALSSLH